MILLLAVALAQDPMPPDLDAPPPVEAAAEAPTPVDADGPAETEEAPEPLRFGERTFGLSSAPTWTVYQGRHYLTAPQFADVVGDGPTASLLFLERRRQNRAAAIFVLGGSVILTTGSYLVLLGAIVAFDTPTLGATMAVAGGAMMLGGAAAYYATLAILLLRAPRRNRVDLYYQRDDAEDWVESYNASLSPPIEVRAVVGPGALGIEARF